MTLGKVTGAPRDLKVSEELTLTLYPLRSLHWGVIEEWMRSSIIVSAKEVIKGDNALTQTSKEAIMKTAHKTATQVALMSCFGIGTEDESTNALLRSFEGMLRVIHQAVRTSSAKDSTPLYTLIELDEKIGANLKMLADVFLEVISVSFPDVSEKDKAELEKNLKNTE